MVSTERHHRAVRLSRIAPPVGNPLHHRMPAVAPRIAGGRARGFRARNSVLGQEARTCLHVACLDRTAPPRHCDAVPFRAAPSRGSLSWVRRLCLAQARRCMPARLFFVPCPIVPTGMSINGMRRRRIPRPAPLGPRSTSRESLSGTWPRAVVFGRLPIEPHEPLPRMVSRGSALAQG